MAEANLILENEGLPETGAGSSNHSTSSDDGSSSIRFEDLTVDDDLPIIDRVVRYMRSSIALQRLVHVKMLAETADLAGYVSIRRFNDCYITMKTFVCALLLSHSWHFSLS
jgi:hypothetical protein